MLEHIRTSVVNLDKYIENYNIQKPYLENIGLNPERFSAINAIDDQHENYRDKLTFFSKHFTPKSTIGCSMSHILLSEKLYTEEMLSKTSNIKFFLMMEDDCFPVEKYNTRESFEKILSDTINDITLIDPHWDIIQLHSDALWPTHATYHTHFFCGSTAAYLLSRRGLHKMVNEKVTNHLDFVTQNFIKYNKYRSRHNIFYTDEANSLQRKNTNLISLKLKKSIIEKFIPLRGEKDWGHFLQFKIIKLPGTNHDLTGNEIIDYLFGIIILKKLFRSIK